MRTYRVYLDVAHSDDQITSFTATHDHSRCRSTRRRALSKRSWWCNPNDLSDAAIALVPELAYDSYVTVGLTGQPDGAEGSEN